MLILFAPWLLLLALIPTIYCLAKRKWVFSAILIAFILWGNWYCRLLPVSFTSHDDGGSTIKVLIFNINGSQQDSTSLKGISQIILEKDADVVFVAEDFLRKVVKTQEEITVRYPYSSEPFFKAGHYLLSKMPIETAEKFGGESFLYKFAVATENGTLNLYGCHLASNNYTESNSYMHPDSVKAVHGMFLYLQNVSRASRKREQEVDLLLNTLKPTEKNIILGDFNDISGSSPLNKIERAGFTDAWWKGGNGYGATIHHPLPYRIDHIFYNEGLKLKSIRKVDSKGLSDHDALVAEFWVE